MGRSLRWLGWFLVASFLVAGSAGPAMAQGNVAVRLEPVGGSNVRGVATLTAEGNGTRVRLDLAGLAAGSAARATLHAGTCAAPSASSAALATLTANAEGAATASGRVLFQGTMPVALTEIADGDHNIAVAGANGVVACGQIGHAGNLLPATGATTPWLLTGLLLGAALLAAGGGLRLQPRWRRYR